MKLWLHIRPYLSGFARYFHISLIEAKAQYGHSRLGVLWIPISSVMFSLMLALVFRHSDQVPLSEFFLVVFAGYILWGFISESITNSTDVLQSKFEFAVHNGMSLAGLYVKNLIDRIFNLSMNLALLVAMTVIVRPGSFGYAALAFPIFLTLICLCSLGLSYLVNLVIILFPDLKPLMNVGTRLLFFISPVFWVPSSEGTSVRNILAHYNPIAHFLSLFRQTLGLEPPQMTSWGVVVAISMALSVAAILSYQKTNGFIKNLK